MNPEGTTLREISQTEKDRYWVVSLISGIQKAKLTATENRLVVTRGWGGRVQVGESGRC